jgi:hypothetical protein
MTTQISTAVSLISNAAQAFLKHLNGQTEQCPKPLRESGVTRLKGSNLLDAVIELRNDPRESLATILLKHLAGEGKLGPAECLFLAYQIQRIPYTSKKVSRKRYIELVQLHRDLFPLFDSRFPYQDYLLGNLTACIAGMEINEEIPTALEKILAHAEHASEEQTFNPDLMTRNLTSLLRESEAIDGAALSDTLSRYQDALVILAAQGLYSEEPGPSDRFEQYLDESMSLTERAEWYRLQVISSIFGFWAVLELERSPSLVIPIDFRHFATLTSADGLRRVPPRGEEPEYFVLHLPQGIHMFLSKEEANTLKEACTRIRMSPDYQSLHRIWALLHGTAE